MLSKKDRFSSNSSSSFSSSSSSSQLSTPRAFRNGFLQNLESPRLSSQASAKTPLWDVEKAECNNGCSMPKSNEELRREILELETEILHLEQYLLSLYRTSFRDHLPKLLLDDSSQCLKTPPSKPYTTNFQNDRVSSVSHTSVSLSEMDKIKRTESCHPSLADLLGLNTPNKLSEEIVRLICAIHFKLSDKRHSRMVKNSNFEDMNEECRQGLGVGVVIDKLCLDENNLKSVDSMVQNFRSLVQKLEKVDPTRMAREEKLAFWINIHNALVMHGYLVYGMCEGQGTTSTNIFKAAFNIGGELVNAFDIQSSILCIRACHSGSRLKMLFSPARSSKTSSCRHTYALDYVEPLLHFALSNGASTDPMVQVYTVEGIFRQLTQAREVFIRTNVGFEKETRILLPKVIYNYAKAASLDMAGLFNIILECLTETKRETMRRIVKRKQERCIRWINQDSNFGYIIHCELLKGSHGI